MYAVIVENDTSQWSDKTGELYHFPSRYLKYLQPGTKVIYYKGRQTDKSFENRRLSKSPHYFGIALIGKHWKDQSSKKGDFYCELLEYSAFTKGVPFKINGKVLEKIPQAKIKNYWRDGVRPINKTIFEKILSLSDLESKQHKIKSIYSDLEQSSELAFTSFEEGGKRRKYSFRYERNQELRNHALLYHGYTCMGCEFNFKNFYGEWGEGFIHVHHIKPISERKGRHKVNPKSDLIVLCPNCHSMVHRKKNDTLSLERLKTIIKNNGKFKTH